MQIRKARAENLRLYAGFEIEPHPRLNLILGANAAGKTSLLEALFYLARGRSFRAAAPGELSGAAGSDWTAYGELLRSTDVERIGVGWRGGEQHQRINGERVRLSALARALPLQLIDPGGHRLIEEGPGFRRSYMDWGVFHVEHGFFAQWQRYQRALKQRNQALRQQLADGAVLAWDEELAATAESVTTWRRRHVEAIAARLTRRVRDLMGLDDARVDFLPGWNAAEDLRTLLRENLAQHRRQGSTAQGPHRAELRLSLGGHRARGRVSRGQQKMLVAALVLAQCEILMEADCGPPVILLDDFGAELSTEFQARLARSLTEYPGQVFVTAFEHPVALAGQNAAMFHVEHGVIRGP